MPNLVVGCFAKDTCVWRTALRVVGLCPEHTADQGRIKGFHIGDAVTKNNVQKFGRCGDSNLCTNLFIFYLVQPLIHLSFIAPIPSLKDGIFHTLQEESEPKLKFVKK